MRQPRDIRWPNSPGLAWLLGLFVCASVGTTLTADDTMTASIPQPKSLGALPSPPRAISGTGKGIVCIDGAKVVLVRLADLKPMREFIGHSTSVSGVAFSADDRLMATVSFDNSMRLWNVATGESIRVENADQDFESIVMSPSGDFVAAVNSGHLWIWDRKKDTVRKLECKISRYQNAAAFSADGKHIIITGIGTLMCWNVATGNSDWQISCSATRLAVDPLGKYVATFGNSANIELRSQASGEVIHTHTQHKNPVSSVTFSPKGKHLVSTATVENDPIVWNLAQAQEVARLPHDKPISWVSFSPDGASLYTFGSELMSWDTAWLDNPSSLALINSLAKGKEDNYSQFVRMTWTRQGEVRVPFLGEKLSRQMSTLVLKSGATIEMADAELGGSFGAAVRFLEDGKGATVEPSLIKSIDFFPLRDKQIPVKIHLRSGPMRQGSIDAGPGTLRGDSLLGKIQLDVENAKSLTFAMPGTEPPQPTAQTDPMQKYRALVIDRLGTRFAARDIKSAPSYGEGNHHLPIAVENVKGNIPFRFVRSVDVLTRARTGLIVRCRLTNDQSVVGYLSEENFPLLKGELVFGSFSLDLRDLHSIQLP